MNKTRGTGPQKGLPPGVPIREYFDKKMQEPEFAREYEALRPEFEVISQVIALRNKRKMTQAELAKRIGTKQPSIARLESAGHAGTIRLLQRVAEALDARLEVRLVPREHSKSANGARRARSAVAKGRLKN